MHAYCGRDGVSVATNSRDSRDTGSFLKDGIRQISATLPSSGRKLARHCGYAEVMALFCLNELSSRPVIYH